MLANASSTSAGKTSRKAALDTLIVGARDPAVHGALAGAQQFEQPHEILPVLAHYLDGDARGKADRNDNPAKVARTPLLRRSVLPFQASGNDVANSLYLDLVKFKAQREALEKQLPQHEAYRTNMLAKLQGLPEKGLHYAKLKARQSSLESTRDLLASRQREAQLFAENSPGYYRLFAPATPEQVTTSSRSAKILMVSAAGFLAGAGLLLQLVGVLETLDDRLLTPGDLRRVTGRRLLIRVGEISLMSEAELATWRFRTWSVLQRELGPAKQGNIVLGLVSAKPGEGRSEWILRADLGYYSYLCP